MAQNKDFVDVKIYATPDYRGLSLFRRPISLPGDTMNLLARKTVETGRMSGKSNDQIIKEIVDA